MNNQLIANLQFVHKRWRGIAERLGWSCAMEDDFKVMLETIFHLKQLEPSAICFADNGEDIERRASEHTENACPFCRDSGHKDDARMESVPHWLPEGATWDDDNVYFLVAEIETGPDSELAYGPTIKWTDMSLLVDGTKLYVRNSERLALSNDNVLVPRSLLGAALGALSHPNHPQAKTIEALRDYAYHAPGRKMENET